jgi:uncharacterized protein YaaQ
VKLMICICQNKYASEVIQNLNHAGYRFTKLASSGGFLKKGNTTLLIGVNGEETVRVMDVIKQACDREDRKKQAQNVKETFDSRSGTQPNNEHHRVTIFVVGASPGISTETVDNS